VIQREIEYLVVLPGSCGIVLGKFIHPLQVMDTHMLLELARIK
jgi:hypothetical protein